MNRFRKESRRWHGRYRLRGTFHYLTLPYFPVPLESNVYYVLDHALFRRCSAQFNPAPAQSSSVQLTSPLTLAYGVHHHVSLQSQTRQGFAIWHYFRLRYSAEIVAKLPKATLPQTVESLCNQRYPAVGTLVCAPRSRENIVRKLLAADAPSTWAIPSASTPQALKAQKYYLSS